LLLTGGQEVLLALAAVGAGAVNGAAGGGTLVSFPALLAVGYPALTANVTSSVGIWTGYLGGTAGFRRELSDQGPRLRELGPTMVVGSVVGGVLLLTTPSRAFALLAPYLLLAACTLFVLQPVIAAHLARRGSAARPRRAVLHGGCFLSSVYGAYFGAGLGVMLLAVLALALPEPLVRISGLRSVISLVVNTVAVAIFVVGAHVGWAAAGAMALGALVGGYVGAGVARRVPTGVLRAVVVTAGLATALDLLLS
jgi:hypothetical protein